MSDPLPVFPLPSTYESLPVSIQAVRWDGTAHHAVSIVDWIHQHGRNASYACDPVTKPCSGADEGHLLIIRTLEGNMTAEPGTWIIKGTEDEFYPCKDSVFQRKYREQRTHRAPEINVTVPVINIQGGNPTGITPAMVARMITHQAITRG